MRQGTDLKQSELKSGQTKKEIYSDNLTINKKDLRINENKKKIMNYNNKNNEINYNNNVKGDLFSNNNNEDANEIDDVFFNDMQTECQAAQTLLVDTFPLSLQNIPLMTNNSHPGKLFEINSDNFSHKSNIFDNVDLNNKNNSTSRIDDNKSNIIVSHMLSTFNKSNDEQKEHSSKKDYERMHSGENASTIIQTVIDKKENIENVQEKITQISEEEKKNIIDKRKHFMVNNKNKEIISNFIHNPIRDMTLNERLNLLSKINTNQTSKRENLLNNNSHVLDVPQQEAVKTEENNKKTLKNKKVNVNHNNLILPFTETINIYDTSQEENKPKSALNFNVKIKCEEKNITLELKSIHVNNSIKFIKETIKHMLYKQTNIRTIKSMILFIKENKMEDNKKIKDFYDDLINEKEVICQIEYLNLNIGTKHIKKECNDNNNS